ncbi:hypothetical protein Pmi06nite_60080 [Planotetraspora mira]|uniref:Uncharacterized protein n=1 Tax=Planotetraspora mira TaxID=58121 RepID=A0A8J3TUX0_9ACTN|nr:hypothetical protein Pmi06nite_60080 [Planotetraspora mira]
MSLRARGASKRVESLAPVGLQPRGGLGVGQPLVRKRHLGLIARPEIRWRGPAVLLSLLHVRLVREADMMCMVVSEVAVTATTREPIAV